MSVSAVKIIQPGEIQGLPDDETPLLVLALPGQIFNQRATRFTQLATGALSDWLGFCAALAKAQAQAIQKISSAPVDEAVVLESIKHGVPPLSISTWNASSDWQAAFDALLDALTTQELPDQVQSIVAELRSVDPLLLQQQAHAYLIADESEVKLEWAPLIGAALQMIWVKRAESLAPYVAHYKGQSSLCPVCGSHPVASVVRVGDRDGHRYLACSLCFAEWYGPRARCTNCETPKEVSILGQTKESLVQGECCDDCHGYLKIMYQSRDPMMEVAADDLASIQLDLALANEGYQRTGRNLLLMVGAQNTQKET